MFPSFGFFFTLFLCVSAVIETADVKEQRFCIKFCFKNNKTEGEIHRILKEVLDEQALSQARTFEWFKRFKDGRKFRSNIKSMLIIFFLAFEEL